MNRPLTGRVILIAEDEPLIALHLTLAFEDEGAWVIRANTLKEALLGVANPALSAAILDHALSDGDTSTVCECMRQRDIPFVIYSGYDQPVEASRGGVHVRKPANMPELVATVERLIAKHQTSNQRVPGLKGHPAADGPRRATLHLS